MLTRKQLAMKCVDHLRANGHSLMNCSCGRVHVGPMGIVNPRGWTQKESRRMFIFEASMFGITAVAMLVFIVVMVFAAIFE